MREVGGVGGVLVLIVRGRRFTCVCWAILIGMTRSRRNGMAQRDRRRFERAKAVSIAMNERISGEGKVREFRSSVIYYQGRRIRVFVPRILIQHRFLWASDKQGVER